MSKALSVACVCLGLALVFSAPLPAAEQSVRFNIPAQPLSDALLEFSGSSGVKVFFSSDDAKNLSTCGLSGNYTSAEALQQFLHRRGAQRTRLRSAVADLENFTANATRRRFPPSRRQRADHLRRSDHR